MESSRGRGGGERPPALGRDLDVDLDFDRFGPGSDADTGGEALDLPDFVQNEPPVESAQPARGRRQRLRRRPTRGERGLRRPRTGQPEPGPRRRSSETLARVLWALPWVVVAVAIVVVGGLVFAAAMIGFAAIGLIELFRMTRDSQPFLTVAIIAAAGMVVAGYYGDPYQIVLAGAALFPLMFFAAALRPSLEGVTSSMAVTAFGVLWLGIPFAHAVLLRELPLHGGALLIDVLVGTFITDTAAYGGGRLFGRHQLAPKLSPNKTVEGLLIGFVGGTLGFWFAGLYQDWLSGIDALIMGMAVAALAPMGDLFESMIKRDLDVKDSGNVFGPHGGLLDRLDAVLFTIVAGYYLSVAFVY
jgi:phosphatidate cytidylyltransferase